MFNFGQDNASTMIVFTLIIWVFALYFFYLTYNSFRKNDSIYLKIFYLVITFLYTLYALLLTQTTYRSMNKQKQNNQNRKISKGFNEKRKEEDKYDSDSESESESEEIDEDLSDNENKNREPKIRTFRTKQDQSNKKNTTTLTFSQLSKIYDSDKFLKMYVSSLTSMCKSKLKDYRKQLKEINKNISELNYTNHSGRTDHGPLERAKQTRDEIKLVIKKLNHRINNINQNQVKNDLYNALFNPSSGIISLMGRDDIKDFLSLQIYTFARNPQLFFLNFQNIAIYGPSGVGKTKVGETMAYVYAQSGILARQKMTIVTKTDLTNMYINGSADVTRKHINSSLEGILFIDEAYELAPDLHNNNSEVITELVKAMDVHKGKIVVIVAGYEKEMEEGFMKANEGLSRRFPNKLKLDPYDNVQLTNILISFIERSCADLTITDEEAEYLFSQISKLSSNPRCFDKQAGDMFNLSADIVRSIYGHIDKTWIEGAPDNNIILIQRGIENFLKTKNIPVD